MKHLLLLIMVAGAFTAHGAERTLKIVVDASAPPEIREAARDVLAHVGKSPLLNAMAEGQPPSELTDSRALAVAPFEERAYSHLVVIGLPQDPIVQQVWQREAAMREGGLFVFGFGHFLGEIGYIESDRNPFLHGREVKEAPFEAEVVTLTGVTPAAVKLATKFFLEQGLINGVIGGAGWRRGASSLLERAPLQWNSRLPEVPQVAGEWSLLGITQAAEEEYRGVLEDAGVAPEEIWRIKYYRPGVWDGAGARKAFDHYSAGLHRRAYGNTLWRARFASEAEAAEVAPKVAMAAGLHRDGEQWRGKQPPYGQQKESPGELTLWQQGVHLYMSTLPLDATTALARALQ